MKDVECYELFGGIALKNHAFSFHFQVEIERQSTYLGNVVTAGGGCEAAATTIT